MEPAKTLGTLDSLQFALAIQAGARAVSNSSDWLNRINVFPVSDGDTGLNMATTLNAVAERLGAPIRGSIGHTARKAADAALEGARGNSGAILAQSLHGFAEYVSHLKELSIPAFAEATNHGTEAAYRALKTPVEGTILSVLRAWSMAVVQQAKRVKNFRELIQRTLPPARDALEQTPNQLEVLALHRVVDAGGQGFVYFLEGIASFFSNETPSPSNLQATEKAPDPVPHAKFVDRESGRRFCCEAVVSGSKLDQAKLMTAIEPLGESNIVAGNCSRLKVHLHSDRPRSFFRTVARYGLLDKCKVDDMFLQESSPSRSKVALLLDSTCDLPEHVWTKTCLYRVPLWISFGTDTYLDEVGLPPAAFHQRLQISQEVPKTSQPTHSEFCSRYRMLLERYDQVLSLHIASALSGTYQAAVAAAQKVAPDNITVVDSCQVSIGIGLIAQALIPAIEQGATLEELRREAQSLSKRVRVFGTVPSLKFAVRGGRVRSGIGWIADLLNIKPLIAFDEQGRAFKAGTRLGFYKSMAALVEMAKRYASGAPARVMAVHADAERAVQFLAETAGSAFDTKYILQVEAGAVLATHVGPGAVALGILKEKL